MAGKMTSFERRLEELFFITNRRQTSAFELANYFSVSESTIYRDVAFLSRYAPIYTKNGMYGGVFIANDYKNSFAKYLSKDEKRLLIKLSKSLSDNEAMLMKSIINKFSMPNTPNGT